MSHVGPSDGRGNRGWCGPARAAAMGPTCTAKSLGASYERIVAPKGNPLPFELRVPTFRPRRDGRDNSERTDESRRFAGGDPDGGRSRCRGIRLRYDVGHRPRMELQRGDRTLQRPHHGGPGGARSAWASPCPRRSSLRRSAGRPIVFMGGLHCGSLEQAERDFAPMRAFGSPIVETIEQKPYLVAQHLNDEPMEWGHRFSMKSGFTASLPQEMVDGCVAKIDEAPKGGDCSFTFWSMGRAIARSTWTLRRCQPATRHSGRAPRRYGTAPGSDQAHREWVRSGCRRSRRSPWPAST